MSRKLTIRAILSVLALALASAGGWYAYHATAGSPQPDTKQGPAGSLEGRFATQVQPFVEKYCLSCHGSKKPKAQLDLSRDLNVVGIVKHMQQWEGVLERLDADEMPPEDAKRRPTNDERKAVIAWLRELRAREAEKNAGDPGIVLARRLSNAEYDYTIRDLTGVDIRPTREFPVDPANQTGFDNTGESLAMSPALLRKYLAAARHVADHVVLKPEGFVFAPHPIVTETDRDKYCVQRIIDFYKRHEVDFADYLLAAKRYHYRVQLSRGDATLSDFAAESKLNPKYLAVVHSALTEAESAGPMAALQGMWQALPIPKGAKNEGRSEAVALRDTVVRWRKQLKVDVKKISVNGMSAGAQPIVLWRNSQFASKHRSYAGDVWADLKKLGAQLKPAEAGFKRYFTVTNGDQDKENARRSLERFCNTFPGAFVITDRGPYFAPNQADKGRPLTAGFHLMQGYFRDDQPLCDLILDERGRREIDALWHELNFMTLAPMRQYADFIFFERAEPPRFMFEAEFDFARSEDKDCTSEAKMARLAKLYLAKARKQKAGDEALKAIETYFAGMSAEIRKVERARLAAEPSHLDALVNFAERAYRRPLAKAERDDLLAFYRQLRKQDDPGHEEALRDVITSVLISPHFCYRFHRAEPGKGVQLLSNDELANRLSYFLWSSMPDVELLEGAKAGDLHKPEVLLAQTRRMLRDPKVRGLAAEFAGNWLDIRRFEEHNAVDRQRFPTFTNELRQAMFEEPIRYFSDIAKRNRSVLDLLYGNDTFVNPILAKHYGIPFSPGSKSRAGLNDWVHIENADQHGRGSILPMAVFLTKNAPGLRTSPVKRGYWVVRRVLGEQIPPPPPTVPELPKDEAKLGELTLPQVLARHRADKACASCHKRFDAVGVVFEDFGPIGERRTKDLGGRPVETGAAFPDGKERAGLAGLRAYLKEKRQDDFVDNLCKKLFSYALGRSLHLSDTKALGAMRAKLVADEYRFGSLVETIVSSPQFFHKRGREEGQRE
ncbi:MAG: DUF1592 domain-containing protein [Gemmataceae bacterium]|nr:DUF1592 domain-containing protein [Gemmataceae bacterium]